MPKIKVLDMKFLDEIFQMGGGYVLDFSDRTMASFFADELNIDIYDVRYAVNGTSKAKRLRCFLQAVDVQTAIRVLDALWTYRSALRATSDEAEPIFNAHGRLLALTDLLQGKGAQPTSALFGQPPMSVYDHQALQHLKADLLRVSTLESHERGYAFEAFLTKLFNAYGLKARDGFRNRGEQIDGSFELDGETYLVEAKWHAAKIGVAELFTFQGKIDEKAAWARGLFISNSGFTEDGLHAFGRGKRLICMDGLDLSDALDKGLPINHVISRKVRDAAETGQSFARVRDLFP
jgi:Restriction endonuclease